MSETESLVADSIRAVAQQVIACADDYAVGSDDLTGLKILLDFQVNCVPSITVQKDYSTHRTHMDNRCRVWTRYADKGDTHG